MENSWLETLWLPNFIVLVAKMAIFRPLGIPD